MEPEKEETKENPPEFKGKRLKINSIKNPSIKRILKPCEARAGHGAIAMMILLSVFGLVMYGLSKVFSWFE